MGLKRGHVELKILTVNEKGYPRMGPRKVMKDFKTIASLNPDLVGFQEVWFPDYIAMAKSALSRKRFGFKTDGFIKSGTMTARKRSKFNYRRSFVHLLHGGVKVGRTRVCWKRNIVGEVLEIKGLYGAAGHPLTIAFMSGHKTPSGWGKRFNKRNQEHVQKYWWQGADNVNAIARDLHRAGVDFIVFAVDANATNEIMKKAYKQIGDKTVRILTSPHGHKIDHLVVWGPVQIIERLEFLPLTNSDHRPYGAKIRFFGYVK